MVDRAIGIGGLALAVLSAVLPAIFPNINKKLAWAGIILGVALLGAAGGMAFLPNGEAQSQPNVRGNCNNFGNNNFNCNTLNLGPIPRGVTANQQVEITNAATVPPSERPKITVHYDIPCQDCVSIAKAIKVAFSSAKWEVVDSSAFMSAASAIPGITIGITDESSKSKYDELVSRALAAARLPHGFLRIQKDSIDTVDLFIGPAPIGASR
jgi:hypothetical protein